MFDSPSFCCFAQAKCLSGLTHSSSSPDLVTAFNLWGWHLSQPDGPVNGILFFWPDTFWPDFQLKHSGQGGLDALHVLIVAVLILHDRAKFFCILKSFLFVSVVGWYLHCINCLRYLLCQADILKFWNNLLGRACWRSSAAAQKFSPPLRFDYVAQGHLRQVIFKHGGSMDTNANA